MILSKAILSRFAPWFVVLVLAYLFWKELKAHRATQDRYANFAETFIQNEKDTKKRKYMYLDEVKSYLGARLDSIEKEFKVKDKNITNIHEIHNHYSDTFVVHLTDTTTYVYGDGKYFRHTDGCFDITGYVTKDEDLYSTWSLNDTLMIVGVKERKRLKILPWEKLNPKWGKMRYYLKVKGKCDNAVYHVLESIDIRKK